MSQSQSRLPNPSTLLWKNSKDALADPQTTLDLHDAYQSAHSSPAYLDIQGVLEGLKTQLEAHILRGEIEAKDGTNVLAGLRAAYGIVLQLLARPEIVARKQRFYETALFGTNTSQKPADNPPGFRFIAPEEN